MRYRATKTVNLGGGHLLAEGQTIDLPSGSTIPGLEPVLERVPAGATLEREAGGRNLDAPGRGRPILERV